MPKAPRLPAETVAMVAPAPTLSPDSSRVAMEEENCMLRAEIRVSREAAGLTGLREGTRDRRRVHPGELGDVVDGGRAAGSGARLFTHRLSVPAAHSYATRCD